MKQCNARVRFAARFPVPRVLTARERAGRWTVHVIAARVPFE